MSERVTVGIEIHQQLDTNKLFCSCPSDLVEENGVELHRRLRPTQSEMGEVDRAALAQAERGMRFRYLCPLGHCCLVEADEEPPHDADAHALEITLLVAVMTQSTVMDEVHFMRKIVIDGSNTSGFQRTALIALGGHLEVNGKRIGIQSICLEEDAARKVEAKGAEVTYRLDRLGIPLIEIATGPDMHDPEEVREVAARLGSILRATKRVKRGLGTIREDLNISIPGGARVEIKGVQDLNLLPTYVEQEMERQGGLVRIQEILEERKVVKRAPVLVDLSAVLAVSRSKVICTALGKGGKVFGCALPGFEGLLKSKDGHLRLGAEMAQYARTRGVAGIFHSDELPGYGITGEEVGAVRKALGLVKEEAFVLCADEATKAGSALSFAGQRAYLALEGVPEETRDPLPEGGSVYSRPLPGAGRMYPETDVRPITIPPERLQRLEANLPELPDQRVKRLARQFGVHEQQARQLVRDGQDDLFEELAALPGIAPTAARTFLSTYPELEKEGIDTASLPDEEVRAAFLALSQGHFAKEALPQVLRELARGRSVPEAIRDLGLGQVGAEEAEAIVDGIIAERGDFVRQKGRNAIGPLMAPVMERLRGKLDGKAASDLLKRRIEAFLSRPA